MPLCYTNGKTIFFAHVPKTGGSSIEDYLLRRFGAMALRDAKFASPNNVQNDPRHRDVIPAAQHLSAAALRNILPQKLDYCFAMVRNPVDRMISQYKFQSGFSRMSRLGFSTWLRVMLSAAQQDPRVYGNHIRPQIDLIPEGAEIFRLEDGFEMMIARLDGVTGASTPEIEVQHLLKRPRKEMDLTRQDIALIRKFYAADYESLPYEAPDEAGHRHDGLAGLRTVLGWVLARLVVMKQRRAWVS